MKQALHLLPGLAIASKDERLALVSSLPSIPSSQPHHAHNHQRENQRLGKVYSPHMLNNGLGKVADLRVGVDGREEIIKYNNDMKTITWSVSDLTKTIKLRSNELEFQDESGEWHHFTIIATPEKIVFGGNCNAGFLESGFILREEFESIDETLQELDSDLRTFYNLGKDYVSRIVFNDRM